MSALTDLPSACSDENDPVPGIRERDEISALAEALRECRKRLHRGALESTRRIATLSNEVSRLEVLNTSQRRRLELFESCLSVIETSCRLMRCGDGLDSAAEANQVRSLEQSLNAARQEYEQVAAERDALVQALGEVRLQRKHRQSA